MDITEMINIADHVLSFRIHQNWPNHRGPERFLQSINIDGVTSICPDTGWSDWRQSWGTITWLIKLTYFHTALSAFIRHHNTALSLQILLHITARIYYWVGFFSAQWCLPIFILFFTSLLLFILLAFIFGVFYVYPNGAWIPLMINKVSIYIQSLCCSCSTTTQSQVLGTKTTGVYTIRKQDNCWKFQHNDDQIREDRSHKLHKMPTIGRSDVADEISVNQMAWSPV